jgi:tetratricopeptide (TPR) repeat protein
MHSHRLAVILAVISGCLAAPTLEAQCSAGVQRQINARQFDPAKAQIQALLVKNARDDAAMHCMGRLLLDQSNAGDAVDWLEKAVAANPKSAQHHEALGLALRTKAGQANVLSQAALGNRSLSELEQAVSLDPSLVDARAALLQLYAMAPPMMGGSIPKAREHAAAILKVNPVRGHMGYSTIAEQEKDFATAEREVLAAITAKPDSEVAYSAAGGFYRRRERWAEAIAMYEKQLKAIPPDAPLIRVSNAHYNLGLAQQRSGRNDRAKTEFEAAVAANPDNDNAKKALASLK